jgi:hypothetical protein
MLRRFRSALVVGALLGPCLFAAIAPGMARAAVVVPLTREALVRQSDTIVRCTVVARKSGWNAQRTQIVTWTTLRIEEYLKGSGPAELTLRQLGGEVDGLVTEVPGDAHLLPGERAVLFLRRGDGVVFLTALAQAAYLVTEKEGGAFVERDLSGLSFARWEGGAMKTVEAAREAREPLAELVRSVRSLVRGRP